MLVLKLIQYSKLKSPLQNCVIFTPVLIWKKFAHFYVIGAMAGINYWKKKYSYVLSNSRVFREIFIVKRGSRILFGSP